MKSFSFQSTSFNSNQDNLSFQEYPFYQSQPSNVRVINKKIVYIIGIPYEIATEETLSKKEYLGQYGTIHKIIVNRNGYIKNESNIPTYSSYVTYSNEIEASLALLSLNNSTVFNHKLNACYGTNKYCNSFLKGIECNNKDCFYLHELANEDDIIIKNDTQMKMQFIEQQKIATNIADIFSLEQKNIIINKGNETKKELTEKKMCNFFPTIDTIYDKKFIKDLENDLDKNNSDNYYYQIISPKKNFTKKKKIEYYSPNLLQYNDEQIEEEDENDEYILVRQPSRHKKKYGSSKYNSKKYTYKRKNCKLKYTLEKYRLKYKIKEDNSSELHQSNKTSDTYIKSLYNNLSGYTTNESSTQNNPLDEIDIKKDLFVGGKKSKFSFVNYSEDFDKGQNFQVPEFIENILDKTFNSLCLINLMKKYQQEKRNYPYEKILLEEELKEVEKWAFP
jgi:hypothetical protein